MTLARPLRLVAALTAAALSACASSGTTTARTADGDGAASTSARPRRSSDVITAEEIAEARPTNAYHAVELLRPTFLRRTNPRFAIIVFVNGARRGGVEELRNLRPEDIDTIRRLNAPDAQMRYGPDLLSGALDVTTKPGRG